MILNKPLQISINGRKINGNSAILQKNDVICQKINCLRIIAIAHFFACLYSLLAVPHRVIAKR
jgi:hypothetical protein